MTAAAGSPDPKDQTPELSPTVIYRPEDSAAALVRILDDYLADLQAGRTPDKAQLLADHPELARELEQCLAGIDFVHRAAKPAGEAPARLGDFQIIREVGRGGMGVVYEAEQLSLKRKVALKVLRFGVTADAEVTQRFQREAETVAHLHHTNIVPIHAVGCEQGVHYYAMQFIEGHSLSAVVDQAAQEPHASNTNRLPFSAEAFRQTATWMLQAAEALAYAHQRGVIHRDVKPSNLILDPDGTVWLTDFGLAKRADEVTMTAAGILMGTPRYMSPEQAASVRQPIDHRTDIYSLGATLYELATGQPVFDSQTPQGVITQILNSEPIAPRIIQGQLPRDLETIILKCLAKDPAKRYQQARDLADDLRAWLDNRPIRARRISLAERAMRWARKHQRSTALSAISAAASLIVLVGGLVAWNTYRESLNGRLVLTTDGPSLVAEVLNDQGELVVPSFPVPTPQPLTVPAGSYHVRLSGSGTLSETWQMDIERGELNSFPVRLIDRLMAPPLEIRQSDTPVLTELNGQMHIFHRGERGWRLTRGDTLKPVWQNDLEKYPEKPEEAPYPGTAVWGAAHDLLQISSNSFGSETGFTPGLTDRAADLNSDGRDDLILASRVSPSLIAVSGMDGKVLWWYRALPNFPKEHDAAVDPFDLKHSQEEAGVLGQPILVHINGEPVVIALMMSLRSQLVTNTGKKFIKLRTYYVEAVAARTGKQMWRALFALPSELGTIYLGDLLKRFPQRPEIAELNGKQTVLFHADTKLFGFDRQTGKEVWPARELGGLPVQAVKFADLDGDRSPEAIVVYKQPQSRLDAVIVKAMSLATGNLLWERSYLATDRLDSSTIRPPGSEVAWVADLDQDGKPEIIVPTRDDWEPSGRHWYGLDALNGATGDPRWQRRLWTSKVTFSSSGGNNSSVRVLIGPDLNGDRLLEVFATSMPPDFPQPERSLQIDALSGQTGDIIWHRSVAGGNPYGERKSHALWWQVAQDGWPQLVVPVDKGQSEQSTTYVIAASTGRLNHFLPEVAEPQVADLNADGISDLYYLADSQGSRRLTVLKGSPPYDWRRSGDWKPGQDYDGDGQIDFLKLPAHGDRTPKLAAVSGRDFRPLWQTELRPLSFDMAPLVTSDVNGDGMFDVVSWDMFDSAHGNQNTISAISGKNGERLWKAREFGLQAGSTSSSGGGQWSNYSYPLFGSCDLDGDHRPEILLAAYIGHNNTVSLGALSNTDGSLLWKIPIVNGAYSGRSLQDRNIWHDLNGDGVLDIVLWVPRSINNNGTSTGTAVRAFSGRDGKPLWKADAKLTQGAFLWPRPAIADLDGDGLAEVVLTTRDESGWDQKVGGFKFQIAVLDGRNGHSKWSWAWNSSVVDLLPPLLVNMDGDGKRVICMGVNETSPAGGAPSIIMLDSQGKVRQSLPVDSAYSSSAWAALDVNSDGKEELLFIDRGHFVAYSGSGQRTLWQCPMTSNALRLDEFRTGQKGGQPATLVAWMDRSVYGLDPATGSARWRCDVPKQDNYQLIADLRYPESATGSPIVASVGAQIKSTIVQHAWPATAAGIYQSPIPQPISLSKFEDPARFRQLPWSHGGIGKLELLVFLLQLGYWTGRRRWRRLGTQLLLWIILTAIMGTVILVADHLEPGEQYSLDGWYEILFIGAGTLGILTAIYGAGAWLLKWARRLCFPTVARR